MKILIMTFIALATINESQAQAVLTGPELIDQAKSISFESTNMNGCVNVSKNYADAANKLQSIRFVNAQQLSQPQKNSLDAGINELSEKSQAALTTGALNTIVCNSEISTEISELMKIKVESLVALSSNSPSPAWAQDQVNYLCKQKNGKLTGAPSCMKLRDGYSVKNTHGGNTNYLPDFNCTQVCKVNSVN